MTFAETRDFYRRIGKRRARREFARGYWLGVIIGVLLLSALCPEGLRGQFKK